MATRYGLLLSELCSNGPTVLKRMQKIIQLSLTFDTYRPNDVMSEVILFVTRIAAGVGIHVVNGKSMTCKGWIWWGGEIWWPVSEACRAALCG